MTNPDLLNLDFVVDEHMANDDTLQILQLEHRAPESFVWIEGFKTSDNANPYYSFGWRTPLDVQAAAKVIDQANSLTGFTPENGIFSVFGSGESYECDWVASNSQAPGSEEIKEVEDLEFDADSLIRLDTGGFAALIWEGDGVFYPHPTLGVTTDKAIDSPWIQELYAQSVDTKTDEMIRRNVGNLVAALNVYLELPFGTCSLDSGFIQSDK